MTGKEHPPTKEITLWDLLIETHAELERQGPGSPEVTLQALRFLTNLPEIQQTADLGCGSGGQTMILAQHLPGNIVGVDQSSDFIQIFNENAQKNGLQERVTGITGSMENLNFPKKSLDLIWSEGAIDSIGFEKGLSHWHGFLKRKGYIAVTCPSWLTAEHPTQVETFWTEAGSHLDTISDNISAMEKSGYSLVAAFTLPEECWTEHYFIPRDSAEKRLFQKYPKNETVAAYRKDSEFETKLYEKYKQHYGYVFYIGQKL